MNVPVLSVDPWIKRRMDDDSGVVIRMVHRGGNGGWQGLVEHRRPFPKRRHPCAFRERNGRGRCRGWGRGERSVPQRGRRVCRERARRLPVIMRVPHPLVARTVCWCEPGVPWGMRDCKVLVGKRLAGLPCRNVPARRGTSGGAKPLLPCLAGSLVKIAKSRRQCQSRHVRHPKLAPSVIACA